MTVAQISVPSSMVLGSLVFRPTAADVPPNTHLDTILAELAADHVALPAGTHAVAQQREDLAGIVADARAHGIALNIVVVQGNPSHESDLRDLATDVGKSEHGTVVVFSDDWVGTYSDNISRARLEWAEDRAKYTSGHTEVAARAFVNRLEAPQTVSWTAVTCAIVAGTVVVAGGFYVVKARRAVARPVAEARS
jgi:hypothetical protein